MYKMNFEELFESFSACDYQVQLMHDVKEGKITIKQWYDLVELRRNYDAEVGMKCQ
jgi:hypothetical protein